MDAHITTLKNWEFILDKDVGYEYVLGHRDEWGASNNLYETSYVKWKIPLQDSFLVITENDSLYSLPYYQSYW